MTELAPEQIDKLRGFLANLKNTATPAAQLPIKQAADAAHPSLNSLLRHIEVDDHGNAVALRFGPETNDLPETILAMTTALFYGIVGMGSAFAQDAWGAEIDACWEIHNELIVARETVYDAQIAAGAS